MISTNKKLDAPAKKLLASECGRFLQSIDAAIIARGDLSWRAVRLHFDDGDIDVRVALERIVVDETGASDEFGIMNVKKSDSGTLEVPEADAATTVIPFDLTVRGIGLVNDSILVYGGGEPVAVIEFTQALCLETDSETIVIDKESWFSEMLAVKSGKGSTQALVYDDSANWEDDEEDPTTHYVFRSDYEII